MRTTWKVSALSLVLVLGACDRRQEPVAAIPDDLKHDLALVSAGGELATATRGYQRARFVSAIEQVKTAQPAPRPKRAHHAPPAMVSHQSASATTTEAAPEPGIAMTSESPEPVSTQAASPPEPTIVIAQQPEPMHMPSGGSDAGMGDQGHGGGLGGLLGGIIGAVVIRGGHGGVDKCDPRTDGRMRPPVVIVERPDFGIPLPTGRPFPGTRRR
jgi:hypothetical protein